MRLSRTLSGPLVLAGLLALGSGSSEANSVVVGGVVAPTVGIVLDDAGGMVQTSGTSALSVTQTRVGNTVTTTVVPR